MCTSSMQSGREPGVRLGTGIPPPPNRYGVCVSAQTKVNGYHRWHMVSLIPRPLIQRVYHLQHNVILKAICAGVGLDLGPRLAPGSLCSLPLASRASWLPRHPANILATNQSLYYHSYTHKGPYVGVIILAAMRARTLCVTFLASMRVHLVVALLLSSEASSS